MDNVSIEHFGDVLAHLTLEIVAAVSPDDATAVRRLDIIAERLLSFSRDVVTVPTHDIIRATADSLRTIAR